MLKLVDAGLTDWSGVEIGSNLTNLQELCLSTKRFHIDNNAFGYLTANAIAINLLELRYLYLPDNSITSLGCIELAANLANLVRLWVRNNNINRSSQLLVRSLLNCNADLML